MIGKGSSSEVYKAFHINLKSFRAIKKIEKNCPLYQQCINEANILKNLTHPNIPTIYDIEEDEHHSYIIEEFFEGISLFEYVNQWGPIKEYKVIDFSIQICELFLYLHSQNNIVLYLDLSPNNILVSHDMIKLIDFGAARCINDDQMMSLSTIGFAAPEQRESFVIDTRSDIYGIGTLMYFLLTGRAMKTDNHSLYGLNLNNLNSKFLKKIIINCVKTNPAKRYQSVNDLKTDLLKKSGINQKTQSCQIAVAGVQNRIGTTHIAFMLTSFIHQYISDAVYISKNSSKIVYSILHYFKQAKVVGNICLVDQCPMLINEEQIDEIKNEFKFQITDYGTLDKNSLEQYLRADIKLMICGNKAWELSEKEYFKKNHIILEDYSEIRILYNFKDIPYCSYPFSVNSKGLFANVAYGLLKESDKNQSLFSKILKGRSIRDKKLLVQEKLTVGVISTSLYDDITFVSIQLASFFNQFFAKNVVFLEMNEDCEIEFLHETCSEDAKSVFQKSFRYKKITFVKKAYQYKMSEILKEKFDVFIFCFSEKYIEEFFRCDRKVIVSGYQLYRNHLFNQFFIKYLAEMDLNKAFVVLLNSDDDIADRLNNEFKIDAINLCVSENPFFVTPETANMLQIIMK